MAAYNTKGPRDIIEDGVSGVLGDDAEALGNAIVAALADEVQFQAMREHAICRAATYEKVGIMDQMLKDIGIG